ncbi:putative shk1 kinase-binding protein [Schistosoma mansoni]|uniref:putative shk1 kinase-binding protein n=1 Tax=Schistosoma mansoni TaxID=6183 RepID=UPI0001A61E27|nr:putative shk1 kinase-binding protein [Schistosoma mansoni]|eukprot:XP_018650354.1 putative shk1 kinase-binding protein [Schistosoma mansoni]
MARRLVESMVSEALVGLDLIFTNDVSSQYSSALSSGFSFLCIDLFHPKSILEDLSITSVGPDPRSDFAYEKNGKSITKSLVGKLSTTIDVDADIISIRQSGAQLLMKELSWAAHLGLPAVVIRVNRPTNPNLARLLINFIRGEYTPIKVWLVFPLVINLNGSNKMSKMDNKESTPDELSIYSPWHWWLNLSTMTADITDALGIVLEIPNDLPNESVISRWFSEPVVCLLIDTQLFLTNSKGYPVLPKSHQYIISRFFKLNVQIVLTGACRNDKGYTAYQQYITWLWQSQDAPDLYEEQSKGLEDQLQEPLQPLRDNLSSTTYSIFEMDPFKYQAYETHVNASINHNSNTCQVVMVLGAGRGPLVNATINAAERAQCKVRIYAVEKNPNALCTLRSRINHEWQGLDVQLIEGDMRNLKTPEQADIFVSELLGSFGDNELSPECLDGAQPMLKDDGISIPCSYTSYVAPLQSLQIYNETRRSKDVTNRVGYSMETPYVVRLRNCQILSSPQPAFTFEHPKKDLNQSNAREVCCSFNIQQDAVVHGIAGYFEAVLYKDVTLSTHPDRHSPQMVSWFPLVFPFEYPIHVHSRDKITLYLWRNVSSRYVWYEWVLTEPRPTKIHNAAGHVYKIAL